MSGFAFSTGEADGPPTLPPIALADTVCAMHSAFAAMCALYWRDLGGGTGQYIDASTLETMFGFMGDVVTRYHADGERFRRNGNGSRMSVPRNTYETADGRWVALSGSTENVARRILRIVGGDELVERFPDMDTRIEHADELDAIVADWMAERTREEVIDVFEAHEAALGPVYDMADIFEDDHYRAREAVVVVSEDDVAPLDDAAADAAGTDAAEGVAMRNVFPKLSETPGGVAHAGRPLGADAREVLSGVEGLTDDEIEAMVADGVTTTGE
jgi:formyl-CoA transferase